MTPDFLKPSTMSSNFRFLAVTSIKYAESSVISKIRVLNSAVGFQHLSLSTNVSRSLPFTESSQVESRMRVQGPAKAVLVLNKNILSIKGLITIKSLERCDVRQSNGFENAFFKQY